MRKIALILLVLLLPLNLLLPSSQPYKRESFYGLAQPYFFTLARWEMVSLWAKGKAMIEGLWKAPLPPTEEIRLVKRFFLYQERIDRERVESILARQIRKVLKEEGLPFPPLLFRLDDPPHLLIVSPRHKIELQKTILLKQGLSLEERESLEKAVERLGVSALVERVGGIAAYPSLVQPSSLKETLSAIAHEWFHHYFFLHPLGRNYAKDMEMTTINETAADLAAEEIASRILPLYSIKNREAKKEIDLEFRREMRRIRTEVESYLKMGQIERAERFMEESRQMLAEKGYFIRKLNQAYFAYHGTYADSPASISPIGEELKALRAKTPSLGEFVRKVAQISDYEELKKLIASY